MMDSSEFSVDKLRFTIAFNEALGNLAQTPNVLRGFLKPIEGVALMLLAQYAPGEGTIVEIGSFLGKSTCWLALGARAGRRGRVTAVDWFKPISSMPDSDDPDDRECMRTGSTFWLFEQNIRRLELAELIDVQRTDSMSAAAAWPGTPIRLLFIDGHHDFRSVQQDFSAWARFVPSGGVIAFHDYVPSWPEVMRFYDEVVAPDPGYVELFQCRSLKVIQKR